MYLCSKTSTFNWKSEKETPWNWFFLSKFLAFFFKWSIIYTLLTPSMRRMPRAEHPIFELDHFSLGECRWTFDRTRDWPLPVSICVRTQAVGCFPSRPENGNRPMFHAWIDMHHDVWFLNTLFANQLLHSFSSAQIDIVNGSDFSSFRFYRFSVYKSYAFVWYCCGCYCLRLGCTRPLRFSHTV